MNTRSIRQLASSIKLNDKQRQILVGLLLGDGHLETQNHGITFRLKVEHSINQREYVDWQYQKFHNMVLTPPKLKLQTVRGVIHQKYWFSTISTGALRFYAQQFYKHGKKIVPKMIAKLAMPQSLAVWFMDDGSLKSRYHSARILNTQCYDAVSLQNLQHMLLHTFQIPTTLRHQKEGQQIYIPSKSVHRFLELVRPYIIPSMEYKMLNNKVTQLPKE